MSKKHFIALADALRTLHQQEIAAKDLQRGQAGMREPYVAGTKDGAIIGVSHCITMLADFCQAQNPRFNRERWLAYIAGTCGPNGGRK